MGLVDGAGRRELHFARCGIAEIGMLANLDGFCTVN